MNRRKISKTSIKLPKITYSPSKSTQQSKNKPQLPDSLFTAVSYGIYNTDLCPLIQFNSNERRQIASLTKMMTLYCTVRLCKKFKINLEKCYFRVTLNAATMRGTTAELQSKQWITILDLLHGLMLPSGNDAATVLAENLGACVYYNKLGEAHLLVDLKSLDLTEDTWNIKIYTEQFIKIMNNTALQIGMKDTLYANPHGLDCTYRLEAYSNAQDQALLAKTLLNQPECFQIMTRPEYTGELKTIASKEVEIRKKTWKNTHFLMNEYGYLGGKTGQTQYAGNCLATYYQSLRTHAKYIVIVLGCASKELRFIETRLLVENYIVSKRL